MVSIIVSIHTIADRRTGVDDTSATPACDAGIQCALSDDGLDGGHLKKSKTKTFARTAQHRLTRVL
jgi:hypothetical protein